MSLPKYLITITLICLLLPACATLEVGVEAQATATPSLPRATNTATALPVTPTPVLATPIPAPEVNQFYLGTLLGQPVLFVRTSGQQSALASEPYLGMVMDEKGYGQSPYDLRQMDYAQPVFLSTSDPSSFSFQVDTVTRRLYLSLFYYNLADRPGYLRESIFEVDSKTSAQRQVWSYESDQDQYPGYQGGALIKQAADGCLVLELLPCFACDAYEPRPALIVNTATGAERLLGLVGDVRLKVSEKVVEYRRLEPTRQKCDPNPICDADGYMTIYEPAGEVISAPMP